MSRIIVVAPRVGMPLRRRIAVMVLEELREWALVSLAALALVPLVVSLPISPWVYAAYFTVLLITAGVVGTALIVGKFRSVMSDVHGVDREADEQRTRRQAYGTGGGDPTT